MLESDGSPVRGVFRRVFEWCSNQTRAGSEPPAELPHRGHAAPLATARRCRRGGRAARAASRSSLDSDVHSQQGRSPDVREYEKLLYRV